MMANFVLSHISANHRICLKYIHTSSGQYTKEKIMKKLLNASSKKKHRYSNFEIPSPPEIFNKNPLEEKKQNSHRRMFALNKLFMRHITDLMATGESAPELLGHGIEVNRVKVAPDYNTVRIYWIARSTKSDSDIDTLLQKNAGILRHELSQLRVMGVVPKLTFVKDKQYAELEELDACLARADFGEEYMPVGLSDKLKSQLELYSEMDNDTKKRVNELEDSIDNDTEPPLPPMAQNILGLNHADILSRVKKQMKKSEALHRTSSTKTDCAGDMDKTINIDPVSFPDDKSERAAFREFLNKRHHLQSKLKREKNYTPDMQYIREELSEKSVKYLDSVLDELESEEDDFVVEDNDTDGLRQ